MLYIDFIKFFMSNFMYFYKMEKNLKKINYLRNFKTYKTI